MATADVDAVAVHPDEEDNLKRSITGRLLFFYVLGDVLGSGIYVLIGLVAAAIGGAFWIAFLAGVTVATVTGLAYAELVTKYPQAAGAALYVHKAFRSKPLTFLITISMLSAVFAAAGSLATGFARYFGAVWSLPPALLVALLFILALSVVNYIGITESVVANMIMTFVEVFGLIIVMIIGVIHISRGDADFSVLTEFTAEGSPVIAVIAGVALAFFAMTGFENAANVAEETVHPERAFPRALVGGMIAAGVIYVLVAMTAALVVPIATLGGADAALLEVVKAGVLPIDVGVMTTIFAFIAMIAITNTTLVVVVTQSRILYGMAREDVVPHVFSKIHSSRRSPYVALTFAAIVVCALLLVSGLLNRVGFDVDVVARLATVTVVFTLFIYALVIVAALKLRGQDETSETFRAPTWLLYLGILGNTIVFVYVIWDDPSSLLWVGGLLAVGLALYVIEIMAQRKSGGTASESEAPAVSGSTATRGLDDPTEGE